MERILQLALGVGLSYAIGIWVAGYYLTRWRTGGDLRELGSGSAGARNVARHLGWRFGVVAFVWDFTKGIFAVLLVDALLADELAPGLAAIAVVSGHIWPIHLGFRGGKGVAPAAGALIAWQPWVLAIVALAYVLGAMVTRDVIARALSAYAVAIISVPFLGMRTDETVACAAVMAILIWTHREGFSQRRYKAIKGG